LSTSSGTKNRKSRKPALSSIVQLAHLQSCKQKVHPLLRASCSGFHSYPTRLNQLPIPEKNYTFCYPFAQSLHYFHIVDSVQPVSDNKLPRTATIKNIRQILSTLESFRIHRSGLIPGLAASSTRESFYVFGVEFVCFLCRRRPFL
jgi:hypothetical protein